MKHTRELVIEILRKFASQEFGWKKIKGIGSERLKQSLK